MCGRLRGGVTVALIALTLLITVAYAEPVTQTFLVSVSNAMSGRLETVPVTLRFGETNGVIERLDGERFVQVPIRVKSGDTSQEKAMDRERLNLIRRLQRIQLPALKSGPLTLSNAVELITDTIHRADMSTQVPIRLRYQDKKGPHRSTYLLPLDIPATNAFAVLCELSTQSCLDRPPVRKTGEYQPVARSEEESPDLIAPVGWAYEGDWNSIVVFIRDGCVVVKPFGIEDWYCGVTRFYEVPKCFFSRFASEVIFACLAKNRLGLSDEISFQFLRKSQRLRVDFCGTPKFGFDVFDQLAYFEEHVLAPLIGECEQPQQFTCIPVDDGQRRLVLARATHAGGFLGTWCYVAEQGVDGMWREAFEVCPLAVGRVDDERVVLTQACVEEGQNKFFGRRPKRNVCWAYTSDDGAVFRFEHDRFVPVECQPDPVPLHAKTDTAPKDKRASLLDGVVVPDFRMINDPITNGIAQIQAIIDASPAPANQIRIVLNPEGFPDAATTVSTLSTRFVNAHDLLKTLADITGLQLIYNEQDKRAELVSQSVYTQRMSRVRTYQLPPRLWERLPTKEAWERLIGEDGCSLFVDAYSPKTCSLAVRSAYGEDGLVVADNIVEGLYTAFPGRFTLETNELRGRHEFVLTDTYRNIVRRYRSGIGKDGKRWERFEVVP